jgi:glycosyltransferase involved in cell wall biosynthesis
MRPADRNSKHVLLVGNSALYFILHRIGLARALVARGHRVGALLPAPVSGEHRTTIADAGIAIHEYPYKPAGMNPLVELRTLFALWHIYRDLQPDIVHHLTVKPALYGGVVSRWLGIETRIQSIMGLGFLFNATNLMPRVARTLLSPAFRYALGGRRSILTLENPDDCERLRAQGALGSNDWPTVEILPGSGVDPKDYDPEAKPEDPPIVAFTGRLTKPKGIVEFVEAARLVRAKYPASRIVVCGGVVTTGNPAAVSEAELRAWVREEAIEWWGHRDDMPSVMSRAAVVVLPSYHGEGLPRALLEAAAAARPIITTDTEGCREIGRNGVNGLLVPVGDAAALAEAILLLLNDPEMRARMGREGRRIVEQEFSLDIVIRRTLAIYDRLIDELAIAAAGVSASTLHQSQRAAGGNANPPSETK